MKLKKVAALCSSANAFCLFDRIDGDGVVTQWLGDGCCAFPLHGLPVLSEPELYRMFDVSEKKQDKIYFNHSALPEGLNVEDWCRSEVRAEDMDVTISSGGKVLMPLRFPGGLLFIQSKYLGPLEDQAAADRATNEERERIRDIEEMALPGSEEITAEAKFTKPVSASDYAKAAMKRAKEQGSEYLNNAKADAKNSGAGTVENTPPAGKTDEFLDAIKSVGQNAQKK